MQKSFWLLFVKERKNLPDHEKIFVIGDYDTCQMWHLGIKAHIDL